MITDRINQNLNALFDPDNDRIFKVLISDKNGTIPLVINKPSDIDIGAIASQIEYLRRLAIDSLKQMYIDQATSEFLKYILNTFFDSLQLTDESDAQWVQRTQKTVFSHKLSRATIIFAMRPFSSQEPELANVSTDAAFGDFSYADVYVKDQVTEIIIIVNDINTWASSITPPESSGWRSIAYGNGVFVAVATTGTNRVMRSTDYGLTWTAITSLESNAWYSVAYGNNVFVAVSVDGTNRVMRSVDYGLTWTAITSSENNEWYSVAYGNGIFVAVAATGTGGGTNRVMRSVDFGLTWTAITAAEDNEWYSVAYGNGVFVAVAVDGTNIVMRSTDYGLTWTAITAANNGWVSVAYGNDVFVAVAATGSNQIMRSTDYGLTWVVIASPEANAWNSIIYGDNIFVAVAGSGTNRIMISDDYGLTWSAITAPEANAWYSVVYGNGVFVSAAATGTNRAMHTYHEEIVQAGNAFILPAVAEDYQSAFFTIKVILWDTALSDIFTVQDILDKIVAAGISVILQINYSV